jgi:hypothetical protein
MSLTRTQSLGVLGALVVVMVVVYARAFRHPAAPPEAQAPMTMQAPDRAMTPASSSAVPASIPAATPELLAGRASQHQYAATLAWGRDPFVAGEASGEGSGLELSGILWDPAQPMAIINGQTFHPGEECEGYRVVEITQETVTLTDGTDTFRLTTVR